MAKRIYKNKDGKRVPSVTTILGVINKPALLNWANRIGLNGIEMKNYVDDKADIGTLAHAICEFSLVGTPIEWGKYTKEQILQACKCAKKFFEWKSYQNEFIPIASELELISEKYQYGGCCDLVAILNGRLTLVDFKTCSGVWDEAKFQTSAYKQLINENFEKLLEVAINPIPKKFKKIQDVVILRIGRDEEEGFEYYPVTEVKKGFNVFKSALKLYLGKNIFAKAEKEQKKLAA